MTASTTSLAPATDRPLSTLPVALFGSVMGFTGLSAAWGQAHAHFGAPAWIGSRTAMDSCG